MRHAKLIEDYRNYIELTRTEESADAQIEKLRPMLTSEQYEQLAPEQFTATEFERFLATRKRERNWQPRTIQMLVTYARQFTKWASEHGIAMPHFAAGIRKPKNPQKKVVFYRRDEVAKLLVAAKGTPLELVVLLAAHAGCRKGDLAKSVDWSDVAWDEGFITIRMPKVGRSRTLPMSKALSTALRERWEAAGRPSAGSSSMPSAGGTSTGPSGGLRRGRGSRCGGCTRSAGRSRRTSRMPASTSGRSPSWADGTASRACSATSAATRRGRRLL